MTVPSLEKAREGMKAAEVEQAYWDDNFDEVIAKYRDHFVAVKDGQVLAAEDDLSQLILLLSSKNVDIRDTWVRFVTEDHSKMLL